MPSELQNMVLYNDESVSENGDPQCTGWGLHLEWS